MIAAAEKQSTSEFLRGIFRDGLLRGGSGRGGGARLPVDLWADRHRVLVGKRSKEPGPWRTSRTPYLRRIMRMFGHPAVRRITMMFGPQLGKTECIENCKLWLIAENPGPTLVVYGNLHDALQANVERFIPAIDACGGGEVRRHLLPSPRDVKQQKIEFDNCTFWFFGSNAKSGRRQRAIQNLFLDELETFTEPTQGHRGARQQGKTDPGWVEVYDRVGTFEDHKIVESSTPGDENSGIHECFLQGDREQFWVPCLAGGCGHYQVLDFDGIRWDGGIEGEVREAKARARETVRYECKKCGAPHWNEQKPEMLARGVWAPEGMTGQEMLELAGGDVDKAVDLLPRRHMSFQLRPANSPFGGMTWGDIAEEFVGLRGRVTPKFVQSKLGEPWRAIGDRLEDKELEGLCVPADAGGYRIGFVPEGVLALTLAADVQKDRIYFTVRGWGERGRDTWLIDRRCIPRREGDELINLDAHLDETYARWGGAAGGRLAIRAATIDSGHFTMEVYNAVRRMNARGYPVVAFKGEDTGNQLIPYRVTRIDKTPDGKPLPWSITLLVGKVNTWKSDLLARIRGRAGVMEGFEGASQEHQEAAAIIGGFYLPEDAGEDYLRQMQSEHRAANVAPGGRVTYGWVVKPGHPDNHYWDCENMNLCLADAVGVRGMVGEAVSGQGGRSGGAGSKRKEESEDRPGWMAGA